jgi:hypothetical protein
MLKEVSKQEKRHNNCGKVKGYKSKNYNRSTTVTLQPIPTVFHIICNLANYSGLLIIRGQINRGLSGLNKN